MISIIISTNEKEKINGIKKNVDATIGSIEYEIIEVHNPGEMSLSKAYNKGAARAKYRYFLFLHDDVQILSHDWGWVIIEILDIENCGLVGLAGGKKKCRLPTGHDMGIKKYRFISVVHHAQERVKAEITEPKKVKTLDGVFLAIKKERWKRLKFNEELEGFHFYDVDISLRASERYQNYVAPGITVFHHSKGKFNDSWVLASLKFHKENHNFDVITEEEERKIRKYWYERLSEEKISFMNRISYCLLMGIDHKCWGKFLSFLSPKFLKKLTRE